MTAYVVDTNVCVVANGGESVQASLACQGACIDVLKKIVNQGDLVIDSGNHIIGEYKNRLSFAGQPGVGDAFFKWLFDNQHGSDLVETVKIPQTDGEFDAFPSDPRLAGFDEDDRKFVAVARVYACAHGRRARIQNAVDRDWWEHLDALRENGVTVDFVCGTEEFAKTKKRARTRRRTRT